MVMAKTDVKTPPKMPPRPLPQPPVLDDKCPPGHHHHPGPINPKEPSFDAKDKNDDGKLNADEFNDGRGVIDKLTDPDKFDRYDADNDGYVTKQENFSGQIRDSIGEFKRSKVDLPDWKPKVTESNNPETNR